MKKFLCLAVIALPLVLGASAPARAESCYDLWYARNLIYAENGYCFKTARAINYFGNGGCAYHSEGAVPLSRSERSLIRGIRASERRQGC